jgi:hypothetical protein
MRGAQRGIEDVRQGVRVAGLEGHVSRSAVYLVHTGLGQRRADEGRRESARRLLLRKGMLSHAECERPVTGDTNRDEGIGNRE